MLITKCLGGQQTIPLIRERPDYHFLLYLWIVKGGKRPLHFRSDNLPGTAAVFLLLQIEMNALEILPDHNPQTQTDRVVFFPGLPVSQAAMKAGEEVMEGGVALGSLDVVCAEGVEDLWEHLVVERGALCLLDLGDGPSFPRNSEVSSVLQAGLRGDTFQLSHSMRMSCTLGYGLWMPSEGAGRGAAELGSCD